MFDRSPSPYQCSTHTETTPMLSATDTEMFKVSKATTDPAVSSTRDVGGSLSLTTRSHVWVRMPLPASSRA